MIKIKNILFKGSGVALITPFKNDSINYSKVEELIEFQISNNTQAIIICGTTGESSTLSDAEKKELITFTIEKVRNRIPVIAGTGGNNTKYVIELSKYAEKVGVDGLLLVTPYYNKTTQDGLFLHYSTIANEISIPIILYNVPSRTGLNIDVNTCKKLSNISNIVAIKEASGNISQVASISLNCKENLKIYSGNDDQILPVLSLGGIGVISVLANIFPRQTNEICQQYFSGNISQATQLQLQFLDLINNLFIETNPMPIKEAMNQLGYDVGNCRLPLCNMNQKNIDKLIESLRTMNSSLFQ